MFGIALPCIEFFVGQLFNAKRSEVTSNVSDDFPIETVLTTTGYVSNGNSHPVSITAGAGNDAVLVSRNRQVVDLNMGSGDDNVVIQSHVHMPMSSLPASRDAFFVVKDEDPDYIINSLVSVDGGTHMDNLVVVGTEADDSYFVSDSAVMGGGVSVSFRSIDTLDVSTEEDNDLVSILGTAADTVTTVHGFTGSDGVVVTPLEVAPVAASNVRGHRGVVEHNLTSSDPSYSALHVPGVSVDVLDEGAFIQVIADDFYVIREGSVDTFNFSVYPTGSVSGVLTVRVMSQADIKGNRYFLINGIDAAQHMLTFNSAAVQEVAVTHNPKSTRLGVTAESMALRLDVVYDETDDAEFQKTKPSIIPINVALLPGASNNAAKAVTVLEPAGKTTVAEGGQGFSSDYELYLSPCTSNMKQNTVVHIEASMEDQLTLSSSSITGDGWGADCKATVTVSAVDNDVAEGVRHVILRHKVVNPAGNHITLSDGSALSASSVKVEIYDDETSGIIIQESSGFTTTTEGANGGAMAGDTYTIRLTKQPASDVFVNVRSIAVASDRDLASSSFDTQEREQVHVNNVEAAGSATTSLTFTSSNWDQEQTVYVSAVLDSVKEGNFWQSSPSLPSYLSRVQGPVVVSGDNQAVYRRFDSAVLFRNESNPTEFDVPTGAVLDKTYLLVRDEDQLDYFKGFNLGDNSEGETPGSLGRDTLTGFKMGAEGIKYAMLEVFELFFGDGAEGLTVEHTSEAMHYVSLSGGNDTTRVKTISGPFIVNGGEGADVMRVSSDKSKLDEVHAMLGFAGGDQDEFDDRIILDNSADTEIDDVLNVSRTMVEVESMNLSADRAIIPESSYLLKLRGATGGSFKLLLNNSTKVEVPYPVSASVLENYIQRALIPETDERSSCGTESSSRCSNVVKVWSIGETFAVFFVGQELKTSMSLELFTDGLTSFEPEMFQNMTNDILLRNTDVVYGELEYLDVNSMGTLETVVNVRGTTAITTIYTQGFDDKFFVSSEANQNIENAASVDFLHGWLDYLHEDVTLVAQSGRHRLMISDESSSISKGYDSNGTKNFGPTVLSRESMTDIHPALGNIYFTAVDGHWSDGVNVWLGKNDDRLDVVSVPSNKPGSLLRTTTQVNCGSGDDEVNIILSESEHYGVAFVANGQDGDDMLNASQSSLPVILFGDAGHDRLIGGSNNDVVFGDYGRVVWRSSDGPNGVVAAISGGGGYGDFTDGVLRTITGVYSTGTDQGGNDKITLNEGDDVGIGGFGADVINGDDGRDIVVCRRMAISLLDWQANLTLFSFLPC